MGILMLILASSIVCAFGYATYKIITSKSKN